MSVPEERIRPLFDEIEQVKPLLRGRVEQYDDPLAAQLLSLMDALELLCIKTHFQADCQDYYDARLNARAYWDATELLEKTAPLLAEAGRRISFSR